MSESVYFTGSLRYWYLSLRTRHSHLAGPGSDAVKRERIEAHYEDQLYVSSLQLTTHIDVVPIEYAIDHQIHVLCIPSHTSNILQVHEVSVFGPFKQALKHSFNSTKTVRQRENIFKESAQQILYNLVCMQ